MNPKKKEKAKKRRVEDDLAQSRVWSEDSDSHEERARQNVFFERRKSPCGMGAGKANLDDENGKATSKNRPVDMGAEKTRLWNQAGRARRSAEGRIALTKTGRATTP